jgi:uncharacterized membrane protein YgcG
MQPTDHSGKAPSPTTAPQRPYGGAAAVAADVAGDQPFGPHAAQILATEHWSLLATRSLIWNEAMSRASVFLTVLSASIIALALLADATGFGPHTTTLALVLLPVVLLLGIATYVRQVQINNEEFKLVLAMNRLRRAYLSIEPGLEPYCTTGHHDDERGLVATCMLDHPSRRWLLVHFLINTPDHRRDRGRGLGGGDCRPDPPGGRGGEGRGGGRWGGGVAGGLGRADAAAATHHGPAASQHTQVPNSTGPIPWAAGVTR